MKWTHFWVYFSFQTLFTHHYAVSALPVVVCKTGIHSRNIPNWSKIKSDYFHLLPWKGLNSLKSSTHLWSQVVYLCFDFSLVFFLWYRTWFHRDTWGCFMCSLSAGTADNTGSTSQHFHITDRNPPGILFSSWVAVLSQSLSKLSVLTLWKE